MFTFVFDHIVRMRRICQTPQTTVVQQRLDELWRGVRTAIERDHDVTRIIAIYEKVETGGRYLQRQPRFFAESSSVEISGNSGEEPRMR